MKPSKNYLPLIIAGVAHAGLVYILFKHFNTLNHLADYSLQSELLVQIILIGLLALVIFIPSPLISNNRKV